MNSIVEGSAPVKILIDEMPLSFYHWQISDYSAYQVLSLTALPLISTTDNEPQPLGAQNFTVSDDGLVYSFQIDEQAKWSNGDPVTGYDYKRGIEAVMANKKNRFSRLLSDLRPGDDAIDAQFDRIQFYLKQPNVFFLELLSVVAFSPLHEFDLRLTAGAYGVSKWQDKTLQLERNPYFQSSDEKPIESIQFSLTKGFSDHGVPQVLSGEMDRSCNTAFPYHRYDELRSRVTKEPLQLVMLFSRGDLELGQGQNLLQILPGAISTSNIAAQLHHQLWPLKDYSQVGERQQNREKFSHAPNCFKDDLPASLKVAYEDYYPNKEVLEIMAQQLALKGVALELIEEPYGSRQASCHLRLELRQNPISSPFLFFKSEVGQIGFEGLSEEWPQLKKAFARYQVSGRSTELKYLNQLIAKSPSTLPLFEVPGFVVESDRIRPGQKFSPGQLWSWN